MPYAVQEWLNIALRWTHVFAAIMWVGQTYFFTWLDHTFHHERQVWMVHSGGFYVVDKQKEPKLLDQTLHWFKWEAAFTWISGLLLLFLVYWLLPNCKVRALDIVPAAIGVGFLLEILKYINLLTWPYLRAKLALEYGPFVYTVTIVLWGFVASMVILAGAEWSARRAEAVQGLQSAGRD